MILFTNHHPVSAAGVRPFVSGEQSVCKGGQL